jgi:hypothetical protein
MSCSRQETSSASPSPPPPSSGSMSPSWAMNGPWRSCAKPWKTVTRDESVATPVREVGALSSTGWPPIGTALFVFPPSDRQPWFEQIVCNRGRRRAPGVRKRTGSEGQRALMSSGRGSQPATNGGGMTPADRCAPPPKTSRERSIVPTGENPAARALTPKAMPTGATPTSSGVIDSAPRRVSARNEGGFNPIDRGAHPTAMRLMVGSMRKSSRAWASRSAPSTAAGESARAKMNPR